MKKTNEPKNDKLTRKIKLRIDPQTLRVLLDGELTQVAGGGTMNTNEWCSVGAFVGGCR